MTANDIVTKALKLLGYTDRDGNEQLTRRIMNKVTEVFNVVYEDLWYISHTEDFEPIKALDDKVDLPNKTLGVIPFGVAAFIAQSENDGDSQQLWMSIYNRKKSTLTTTAGRVDAIPRSWDL